MTTHAKLLLVFVDETELWQEIPLYEAVVRRLVQLGLRGATVYEGIMGFGRHQRMHHKGLFGISDDRPITIVVVDEEEKIRPAIPEIRAMAGEALLVLLDAELL